MNLKLSYSIFLLVLTHSAHAVNMHTATDPTSQMFWVLLLIFFIIIGFASCAYVWLNQNTKRNPSLSRPQRNTNKTLSFPRPNAKKHSNGCLIAALIMVMVLILPPLLLLGLCGILSKIPSDQSFGQGVFAVIAIFIIGAVILIKKLR